MASATNATRLKLLGDEMWKRNDNTKISAELLSLTYGALVVQLVHDFDQDYAQVNEQLERMGYNIGVRLIDDFLARSSVPRCKDFAETADVVSKVAFRAFLNTTPGVSHVDDKTFALEFDESQTALNPLTEFVELPDEALKGGLNYSNVLCGVIRGALEMIQMSTSVSITKDILKGDDKTEITVVLEKYLEEEMPVGDD